MGRAWVPKPRNFNTQQSAGKVMVTIYWDTEGVIILDVLPKRSTIPGVCNGNLLDQLRTAIRKNVPSVSFPDKVPRGLDQGSP